jgi:hypothetical protein
MSGDINRGPWRATGARVGSKWTMDGSGASGSGGSLARGGRRLARWAWRVSEEQSRPAYRFGSERSWAVGSILDWAEKLPAAFLLFLILFHFHFVKFDLSHNFCIFHSNKFKPVSKLF